ncbi:MAG TPA: hypothetical protein VNL71_23410 [Chloroflexota bacterium]|nr:hypothetical protein [Chloroflexota bacterium]
MPRIPRLFGRARVDHGAPTPVTIVPPPASSSADAAPVRSTSPEDPVVGEQELPPVGSGGEPDEEDEQATVPEPVDQWLEQPMPGSDQPLESPEEFEDTPLPLSVSGRKHLDLVPPNEPREATAPADLEVEDSPELAFSTPKTLIGGKEDDLVPLIPNTEADTAGSGELDETGIAEAAVESLKSASEFLVSRVTKLRAVPDPLQVVPGLIALIGELDARYTRDMGIMRRNGLEDVLQDVRRVMAEGDRFVLESLENGRGGLTADAVTRDLRTIAPGDRPRMLGHYITFLTFMIQRVLHQYLRALEEDETRTYEISYRLDYLIEGVRDILLARVAAPS